MPDLGASGQGLQPCQNDPVQLIRATHADVTDDRTCTQENHVRSSSRKNRCTQADGSKAAAYRMYEWRETHAALTSMCQWRTKKQPWLHGIGL